MELDDIQILRLIERRIIFKFRSFTKVEEEFVPWVKGMTATKFKTFILQCLDDVVADGDAKNVAVLEIKNSIEA